MTRAPQPCQGKMPGPRRATRAAGGQLAAVDDVNLSDDPPYEPTATDSDDQATITDEKSQSVGQEEALSPLSASPTKKKTAG